MEAVLLAVGVAAAFAAGWLVARQVAATPSREASGGRGEVVTAPSEPTEPAAPTPADAAHDIPVGAVLDAHPAGVVIADEDGTIRYRNAAVTRMSGTHIGVLLDAAIERHTAPEVVADETLEMYGPPKMVLTISSRPLPDGGTVVFVDDISERRRVEQVRTDFVANISHELKTPIGALSVLAETLEDEDDPATVHRVVDRMIGEAHRAARTIDDLMELSRIELGGEREVEAVRATDVVRAAIDRVTELAAQREITIEDATAALPHGGEIVVHGDRRQLESAVGNLVENAVKYSEQGGAVRVGVGCTDGWVEIVVADDGVGIPQRDLHRIFERFYRVDRARSRATGGTGLGLSIVRHVATNHDGEVRVESTEGEGSTFVLRLPIARPDTDIVEIGQPLRDSRQLEPSHTTHDNSEDVA